MASHADGTNLAKIEVEESTLPEQELPEIPAFDDFDGEELGNFYYAPRIMPQRFARCDGTERVCENQGTGIAHVSE